MSVVGVRSQRHVVHQAAVCLLCGSRTPSSQVGLFPPALKAVAASMNNQTAKSLHPVRVKETQKATKNSGSFYFYYFHACHCSVRFFQRDLNAAAADICPVAVCLLQTRDRLHTGSSCCFTNTLLSSFRKLCMMHNEEGADCFRSHQGRGAPIARRVLCNRNVVQTSHRPVQTILGPCSTNESSLCIRLIPPSSLKSKFNGLICFKLNFKTSFT